jgi:hypothetical protein
MISQVVLRVGGCVSFSPVEISTRESPMQCPVDKRCVRIDDNRIAVGLLGCERGLDV